VKHEHEWHEKHEKHEKHEWHGARVLGVGVGVLALVIACAQPTLPPGGPPDVSPPRLLGASPDSGSVRMQIDEAAFQFDEVIAEEAGGSGGLSQLVLISPSSGEVEVRWRRSRITARPRDGFRDSTTYVITLLPGIADLRGNARDSSTVLVFSTGDSIPGTRLNGVVFDWSRGDVAPRAFVQAHPAGDTTLAYFAEADATGRFSLPFLSRGEYVVRGFIDANRNRAVDPREQWDSAFVTLRDTSSVDLYAFVHDTLAPRVSGVTVMDSVTLRVSLDGPLSPGAPLNGIAQVFTTDSTPIPVARVVPWSVIADERAERDRVRRDSIARADTSTVARAARDRHMRDSINRAAAIADSIARDTARALPHPVSARPPLVSELGVVLATPTEPEQNYRLRLQLTGVLGGERVTQNIFSRPRPAPRDTARFSPPPRQDPDR
jgi:hypothetical protein